MNKKDTNKKRSEVSKEISVKIDKIYKSLAEKPLHKAKVLVFDIETSPIKAYTWGVWQQNIQAKAIIDDWFVISWSAKWLFDNEVLSDVVTPDEATTGDDKRVVESLFKLLDEADIVIAHNGKRFDVRKINARFYMHDMKLPSPYKVIDTLQQIKGAMALNFNRLDYIGEVKGFGGKLEHSGLQLWIDCLKGDEKALNDMDEYCKRDVLLLEEVYLDLRPYMRNHPNLALYCDTDISVCPTCSSSDLKWEGTYKTTANEYEQFQCNGCGSWGASKTKKDKVTPKVKTVNNRQ